MKVAFLDRDGTIIEDYEDRVWSNISEPMFIDGAIESLLTIKEREYEVIIITNQYLINEKIITLEQYEKITELMIKSLSDNGIEILDIFYCPHSKKENCNCIKPKDGMIKRALRKYPKISLEDCFLVGDSLCDIQLGETLGIKTFGIRVGKTEGKVIRVNSIKDIIKYL